MSEHDRQLEVFPLFLECAHSVLSHVKRRIFNVMISFHKKVSEQNYGAAV